MGRRRADSVDALKSIFKKNYQTVDDPVEPDTLKAEYVVLV